MPKKLALITVATVIAASSAFASGHSNAPAAKGMVEAIQNPETPKGVANTLRNAVEPSDRGWGNAGSRLLSEDNVQVSKSGKGKDK